MTDATIRYAYLLNEKLSQEHKTMLLASDLAAEAAQQQKAEADHTRKLARLQFWHNTPLVVSLVGIITIAANFISSYYLSDQTGDIGIEQRKREFSYRILETELGKTDDTEERAQVLLFLAKAGVLDGLNVNSLEALAGNASAIPTTIGQNSVPNYNIEPPVADTRQTPAANRLISLAVEEINRNIEETLSFDRVKLYWSILNESQLNGIPSDAPWGAAFISWLVSQAGNPDGLAMTPDVAGIWLSARSKGMTSPSDGPLPGDIAIYGRDETTAARIRTGQFASGFACVVYSLSDSTLTCVIGNFNNAVRLTTQLLTDTRLVGYVRLGTSK